MPKTKLEDKEGFTLVELMVVIAITAIIAALSFSEINSTRYRLKDAAQTLRAKMQQAKLMAVKENCNVFVDFDFNGDGTIDSFYTLWRDADNNNSYSDSSELIEKVLLPRDISFGAVASANGGPSRSASNSGSTAPATIIVSFSGDHARFSPQGAGSNGWAYLCAPQNDSAGTYAVGSNNVGRIQIRYWATDGGAWH